MFFITLLDEQRDTLAEPLCRLYERKVAGSFKRMQSGLREMRRKPLHMCPVRITLPDDE
jgi:hypothetical protein